MRGKNEHLCIVKPIQVKDSNKEDIIEKPLNPKSNSFEKDHLNLLVRKAVPILMKQTI